MVLVLVAFPYFLPPPVMLLIAVPHLLAPVLMVLVVIPHLLASAQEEPVRIRILLSSSRAYPHPSLLSFTRQPSLLLPRFHLLSLSRRMPARSVFKQLAGCRPACSFLASIFSHSPAGCRPASTYRCEPWHEQRPTASQSSKAHEE